MSREALEKSLDDLAHRKGWTLTHLHEELQRRIKSTDCKDSFDWFPPPQQFTKAAAGSDEKIAAMTERFGSTNLFHPKDPWHDSDMTKAFRATINPNGHLTERETVDCHWSALEAAERATRQQWVDEEEEEDIPEPDWAGPRLRYVNALLLKIRGENASPATEGVPGAHRRGHADARPDIGRGGTALCGSHA